MTRITSPRFLISYPSPAVRDEPADVPSDLKLLVDGIEKGVIYGQGTFANRPVSTGGSPGIQGRIYEATDRGILYYDFGTGWQIIGPPPFMDTTAFDSLAGMVDGQEVAWGHDINNGILWNMRYYSAGGPTYHWICQGGAPIIAEVLTGLDSISSTSYVDFPTNPGPTLTVPLDGLYEIQFGGVAGNDTANQSAFIAAKIGSVTTADIDSAHVFVPTANGAVMLSRTIRKTANKADVIKLQGKVTGGNGTFYRRWLSMRPVAVNN
jgi:hypothetical protein